MDNIGQNRRRNFNNSSYYVSNGPNPNFTSKNFNNGGYSNNQTRNRSQGGFNQDQGWSQMPISNPNQSNPTYGGKNTNWFNNRANDGNVMCFRCKEFEHISTYCPNPKASEPSVPMCRNCKQNGRKAEECNASCRIGPTDSEGYN